MSQYPQQGGGPPPNQSMNMARGYPQQQPVNMNARGYPQAGGPPGSNAARGYPQQPAARGYAQQPPMNAGGAPPGRGYPQQPQQQQPPRGYPQPGGVNQARPPQMQRPPSSGGMPPQQSQMQRPPSSGGGMPPQQQQRPPSSSGMPPQQQQARGPPMPGQQSARGPPMPGQQQPARGPPMAGQPQQPARGPPIPGQPQQPARGPPMPGQSQQPARGPPMPGQPQQPARGPPMPGQPQQPARGPPMPGQPQQPARGPPMSGHPQQPARGPPMPGQQQQAPRPPMPGQQQPRGPPMPQQQGARPPMPGQQARPPPQAGYQQQPPPMGGQQGGPPGPGGFQQGPPPTGGFQQKPMPPPPGQFQQQPPPPQQGGYGQPGGYPPQQQQQPGGYGQPRQPQVYIDPESQCDPIWMQASFGNFPASDALQQQSGMPLGVVIQPLAEHPTKEVPVVNFGNVGVVRCRACRGYINPFVTWMDNGRKWRCNLCNRDNETDAQYYSHMDGNGQRADRMEKPELHSGCIEIVAPQEYMIRPPQAPVFMFVLDVSFEAVSSGMLACAVQAIKDCLDKLPGDPRTQVGLITFDYAVHFYSLNSKLTQPRMLVVSDLDELFLPCPEDLLVNLVESREVFEMLLESLPKIHAKNATHEIAAGSAIQAAYRVMIHIGGKMMVFQTKLPTLGLGKLQARENPRVLGTAEEHKLFNAADNFYKTNVSEMCKNQVAIELFLFPSAYCDVASLQSLGKYTGGDLHYYPKFNAQRNGAALISDIKRSLTRETAWEAVFRLRASHGVRVSGFYGNFQLRSTDLMQVPNSDADSTYALELKHTEKVLSMGYVTLQGALLYTNSDGQRRIRVMTSIHPVTSQVSDVHNTANQEAIAAFVAKKAASEVGQIGLDSVRSKLMNLCANVIRAARASGGASMGYGMPAQQAQQPKPTLPPTLNLLPLYTMALSKSPAFRGGDQVSIDERCYYHHALGRLPLKSLTLFVYPSLFEIDSMTPDCGRLVAVPAGQEASNPAEGIIPFGHNQRLRLPRKLNLSGNCLRSNGLFLLHNGLSFMLWVGRGADPRLIQSLFGVPSLDGIDAGVLRVDPQPDDNDFKRRFCSIVDGLRQQNPSGYYQQISVIKEGDPIEMRFRWFLYEDRAPFNGGSLSYDEYMSQCTRLAQQPLPAQ